MALKLVRKNWIIDVPGDPVAAPAIALTDRVALARRRFGQPFAHEPGTRWQPQQALFLTRWMAERVKRGKP